MSKVNKSKKPKSLTQTRSQKNIPPPTLSEIISQDYERNLRELLDLQKKLNQAFHAHPVYQEFARRDETQKQFKRLQKEHKLAIRHASNFHRASKREYKYWLRIAAEPNKLVRVASDIGDFIGRIFRWFR